MDHLDSALLSGDSEQIDAAFKSILEIYPTSVHNIVF